MKVLMCPDLRSLTIDYLRWDQETMEYILGSLVRRHIRGLPKLDYLNLAFTYALEPDRRDVVVSETHQNFPKNLKRLDQTISDVSRRFQT